jgi:clathrin light chain A
MSDKKKEQWREVAKKELEDWYKHREDQLEKAKKNNM